MIQNTIFTGVAGTGKTYRLQQLAKEYTGALAPIDKQAILATLVEPLSWREVICLVFLEQKSRGKDLLKVGDIVEHEFFQEKAHLNDINIKHLNQTTWGNLQKFSSLHSTTVKQANRASQAYFDKDDSSSWYLLEESLPLLVDLQVILDDYLSHSQQVQLQQVHTPTKERFSLVSFHQSYGYDEFVEGIRPIIDERTGQMRYGIQQGAFLKLCKQAEQDPNHRYAMLIDEINRANVAQVFGELMSLIEPSKRVGQANAMSVRLAYSQTSFSVPSNVDIFATMNTQDHSLVSLDSAFRRRFEFVELLPDGSGLGGVVDSEGNAVNLGKLLDGLNSRICQFLGEQYQLGQAYFYSVSDFQGLLKVMARQVLPQLLTYSHNTHNPQVLEDILTLDKMPWLVSVGAVQQGGQGGYGQGASLRVNPELLDGLDSSEQMAFNAESFVGLY